MEPCEKPLSEMALCEAMSCAYDVSSKALSGVFQAPSSAKITDWALTFFAALILLNLLLLLVRMFTRKRAA